jgi:YVTN family beta-propeller protein
MRAERLPVLMTDESDVLYPNAGPDAGGDRGVSRRALLAGSAAAGTLATAGCVGGGDSGGDGSDTVYVFNTGDKTISVIDTAADELVTTQYLGATASFPANQYVADYTTEAGDPLWLNVDQGVRAVDARALSELTSLDTGSGANWQEVTPDGSALVVSAREPTHTQYKLDADPDSDSFGDVLSEIDRSDEAGRGDNDGPGPCDITVHPGGEYAYVPDLFADTLSVIDVEAFEVVEQVSVDPATDADAVAPWMDTATPDGETLLVENNEGDHGTESIWDVSDPAAPEERTRLTAEDNLGALPLTSEVGPDSEVGYVFTANSEDVTVLDLAAGEVVDRIDVGGKAFVGTWDPGHEKLYVPVQTSDEVKVIDHEAGEVTATVAVGSKPYGATTGTVRPAEDSANNAMATAASLGVEFTESGSGTTYCIGECACGHDW